MKQCRVDGCERPSRSAGYCSPHYLKYVIRAGLTSRKPCLFEGCDRPSESKGYCAAHYMSERYHDLKTASHDELLEAYLLKKLLPSEERASILSIKEFMEGEICQVKGALEALIDKRGDAWEHLSIKMLEDYRKFKMGSEE